MIKLHIKPHAKDIFEHFYYLIYKYVNMYDYHPSASLSLASVLHIILRYMKKKING